MSTSQYTVGSESLRTLAALQLLKARIQIPPFLKIHSAPAVRKLPTLFDSPQRPQKKPKLLMTPGVHLSKDKAKEVDGYLSD